MKHYMLGLFDDDEVLLNAVDKVQAQGMKIHDCVTPFAVHGLDHKLGLRESKLHIGGFWVGAVACATALGFMSWVFVGNWPITFGGKPHFSLPAFIPITFEFTVLNASLWMTLAFCVLNHIWPGRFRESLDPRTTSHLFGMVFKINEQTSQDEKNKIAQVLTEAGAVEVRERVLERHY
ncbi:MAG: DUF3341 domain-containing protein [Chitinophagales bacterium]